MTSAWSFISRPAGSAATLSDPTAVKPTFKVDQAGDYVAQLIVNDGTVDSAPDTVTISTVNSRPVANAGPDRTVKTGATVTLDGSGSSDVDGDALTYAWSLTSRPDGSAASLADPTSPKPSFTADVAGTYVAQLIVYDGKEYSAADTVTIAAEGPTPANQPPTFISTPVTRATVGQLYSYQVEATDPDNDPLTYGLDDPPQGMTIDATGLIAWAPAQVGGYTIKVTVTDGKSAPVIQSFTLNVQAANVAVPNVVGLSQTAAEAAITAAGLTVGTVTQEASSTVPAGNVVSQNPATGASVARGSAVNLVVSSGPGGGGELPPDPATVAPPIDPTIATTTYAATQFLYTGANPIQTGVAPGTIEPKRAAVIRGRVLNKANQPLSGVTITILNHPEFGQTLSRADGMFDLAVNGGGYLTINYAKAGYLPAQRQVDVPWQDYVSVPDVVMVQLDAKVTTIDLTATTQPMQVAQGNPVTDGDGSRQATILFPQGVQATMTLPNGTVQNLATLNVRATEYTVGENGPKAMPAELPPTSGYTYAVELSADEAVAAGAKRVNLNQPVSFYVDNFLNFPVGMAVPTGYYDRDKAAWVPSANGRVIRVVSIGGGFANLDTNGDNAIDDAATLAALGITDAERARLAALYAAGKTLWRVPITHFTPWDCNWPFGPPADAIPPNPPAPPSGGDQPADRNKERLECGSVIECQSQTLGESVPVTGTPFHLHYSSARVSGKKAAYTLKIPLSGASVPASLVGIDLVVEVGGRRFAQTFPAAPNQTTTFAWDGLNVYRQLVSGPQTAHIQIGFVYQAASQTPVTFEQSFALASGLLISGSPARQAVTLWRSYQQNLGTSADNPHLNGWSLNIHHTYGSVAQILSRGDGSQVSATGVTVGIITTVAGNGTARFSGDGGPATLASLNSPIGVTTGPDGSLYIAERGSNRIRRVGPNGIITTVAGNGTAGFSGDGGPATAASLSTRMGVSIGPDGSLYIADNSSSRIRRVGTDGIIATVAGNGTAAFSGDGGPATAASLNSPSWITVGPDGSLYIADNLNNRIRRVGPDGIITTVAGNGTQGFSGDGGPAMAASLNKPTSVTIGPDGSLYIDSNNRIRRVGTDGIITTVAGNGSIGFSGDGGPATAASLSAPVSVTIGPDGSLYFSDNLNNRIRRVGPDGIITTVAGNGTQGFSGDGGPATAASLYFPSGVTVGPDGSLYIGDFSNHRIRRATAWTSGFAEGETRVASDDGLEVYVFDSGRHLRTLNARTGAVLYQFGYDSQGRLIRVTDADGLVTTIERDGSGNPTAIVAPFGQRTTLTLDGNGYLAAIANSAGETYAMQYTPEGLLTRFADPVGHASVMSYDSLGRLVKDQDAAGNFKALARVDAERSYTTSLGTALGRTTQYQVENLTTGEEKRRTTFPDGTFEETLYGTDGKRVVTQTDGTVVETVLGPDPRFSMQAPIPTSLKRTTGGLTQNITTGRTASLTDPNNPFSLTSQTDTVTVNGRTAKSVYTAATKTSTDTSAASRISTATFDAVGRVIGAQVTGLLAVSNAYDAQGRLVSTTQGSGAEERRLGFAYNPEGYLDTVTDPLGRTLRYEYDGAGRVTRQILPDNREIRYGYDRNGNLTALTPPGRPAHVFQYTPADLTQEYSPPEVGAGLNKTVYEYDLDKDLTRILRPDGAEIRFAYDSAGRLTRQTLPNGELSYGYNATTGKLTSLGDPDGGGLGFTYNGALLTQTTWTGAVSGSVGFGYDSDFRVTSVSVNGANPIAYQYDADSLLTQAGSLTLSRSSQNGLLTGSTLGQVSDSYTYSGFGEVGQYDAKSSGTSFFKTDYTYDKLGRITRKVETLGASANTYDYTYDLAGRLQEVKLNGGTVSSYGYDDNGNRLSGPGLTVAPTYDDQDRLLTYGGATYTYTANGELKTKAVGVQTTTYDYDVLGNLRKVILPDGRTLDYVIDAANRRTGKKVNGTLVQGFLYQDQLKPVAELDGSGNVVSRFVYATRVNVPDYLVKGSITYRIVTDHLGSPRFVVNSANGTLVQRMDYDEFGNVTGDTNPGFQPFGFAGGLYDRDTKLVRFGARDYDAETGRWTSKDPITFAGQDTNLYAYSVHDPVNLTDPNGDFANIAIGAGIGALLGGGGNLWWQLASNGGRWQCVDWGQVGAWALGGGILGAGVGVGMPFAVRAFFGASTSVETGLGAATQALPPFGSLTTAGKVAAATKALPPFGSLTTAGRTAATATEALSPGGTLTGVGKASSPVTRVLTQAEIYVKQVASRWWWTK